MLINAYRRLTLLVSDNDFDLIIDIHFQKKISTKAEVASPKSACAFLHFN